ncbi:MAG: hypothetical protein IK121_09280, partial [Lachnospiraceae bacterium]|nr:hypothetical protein [Lachnospiraceae bacterium]
EYNGQNPYVITEDYALSPEEMDALLSELGKEYKRDELPEIEALPDDNYVLLCESNGKKEPSSIFGLLKKNVRTLNTPRNLSEEISVDSNVVFVPSVSKSGRMYTFDSLSVKENVSNHENLKSVSLFLEGENYVKETSDISDTGLWSIDNISFSFEEEKPYRFLIEYTYETEVIDTPTVSGSDISENNSQGSNDQSVNGSGEVSGNDTQTPPAGGNDVSDNNGPVGTSDTTSNGGDNSHLERTTKKAYSPAFIIHKVKTGESLRSLASDMGVEASTIKKDNGLSIFFAKKGSTLFINGPKADFVPPFDFSDEAIETFQKLGAKKGSEFAYDAVNLSTLNLLYEEEDINIKEQDTFSLTRYFYSGLSGYKGVFGYGISSIFDERVVDISDDKKLVVLQDMRGILLSGENGTFVSSDGQYTLKENEEDYSLTDLSLNYKNFNKAGYITSVGGKKGELYSLIYDDNGNLRKIKTRAEKEFGISLNRNGFVDEISNPDGTKKTYEYDEKGQLVKVTNERGFNRLYEYDANRRLLNAKNPMGKASIIVSYGDDGLINSYTDGEGNTSVFTKNGEYTSFTDAKGAVTKYWFDNADRNIKTLYPGDKTHRRHHD